MYTIVIHNSCGTIYRNYKEVAFLQGEDLAHLEIEIKKVWKQYKWKKMGMKRFEQTVSDLLSSIVMMIN